MELHASTPRRYRFALAGLPVMALVAAGCSAAGGAAATSADTGAGTGSGSSTATVATADGPLGRHLTDGAGRAVYLWVRDGTGPSRCSGSCAAEWPPVTTAGAPHAGSGAAAGLLGTVDRDGGQKQVTYRGQPLYYYAGDSGSGDVTGQGSDGFGAKWWVVAPSGAAITAAAPGGSGSGSGSGGYGY